jgi:hypothetical protein
MYMRLGFAIAAFLDADILLLDEVFAVGDEAFQRKCFGRSSRSSSAAARSSSSRTTRRRSSGCASASVFLEGAGRLRRADARGVVRYRGARRRREPGERAVGLREWGPARRDRVGDARRHEGRIAAVPLRRAVRAPRAVDARRRPAAAAAARASRRRRHARRGGTRRPAQLGWARARQRDVRFHIGALPLADGRFHLRLGLTDEAGEHVYHWLDDALVVRRLSGG